MALNKTRCTQRKTKQNKTNNRNYIHSVRIEYIEHIIASTQNRPNVVSAQR